MYQYMIMSHSIWCDCRSPRRSSLSTDAPLCLCLLTGHVCSCLNVCVSGRTWSRRRRLSLRLVSVSRITHTFTLALVTIIWWWLSHWCDVAVREVSTHRVGIFLFFKLSTQVKSDCLCSCTTSCWPPTPQVGTSSVWCSALVSLRGTSYSCPAGWRTWSTWTMNSLTPTSQQLWSAAKPTVPAWRYQLDIHSSVL